jgi:hypothetical protein
MSSSRLTSARVLSPLHELLDDSPLELDREEPPSWFETTRGAVIGYGHTAGLGLCRQVRLAECASRGCQEQHLRFESRRLEHGGRPDSMTARQRQAAGVR